MARHGSIKLAQANIGSSVEPLEDLYW